MSSRLNYRTRMALLLLAVVAGLALTAGLLNGLHTMSAEAQSAASALSAPPVLLATGARQAAAVQPLQQCYVITFQQGLDGYVGCYDTRITAERPNDNYCSEELVLGMKGEGRVLVQFLDLERSIPQNARIVNGTLGLYVYNYGQRSRPIPIAAYRVIRAWKECEATWHQATYSDPWGKAGCDDTVTDRSTVALDQTSLYNNNQWYEWDVTAAVADWVEDPLHNRGLVLVPVSQDPGEFDIWHSEYIGPYLRVEYCLGPDVGISKELTNPASGSAMSGEVVEFTIGVINTGTTSITDLTLTDTFDPEYLSYVASSVPPQQPASGTLEWSAAALDAFLPLAADDAFAVTVQFQTLKPTSSTLNCVLAEGYDQYDQPLLPREACDDVEIRPQPPALSLTKRVTDPPDGTAAVGELFTFTLSITNIGETAMTALNLTDTYDSEYLLPVSSSIPPSVQESGSMTWTSQQFAAHLPLAPDDGFEIVLVFEGLKETPSTRNTATAQGIDEFGQHTPPEMDSDAVEIVPPAALEVTKELVIPASGVANVGDTVRFVLGIRNVGGVAISSLTAVDEYVGSYLSPLFPWSVEPDEWMPGIITWTWEATEPFLPLDPQDTFTWTVDFLALAPVPVTSNCLTVEGLEACDDVQIAERFKIYLPAMAGPIYECDPRCGQWDISEEFNSPADLDRWTINKPVGSDLGIEPIPDTSETGLHLFSTADTSTFPRVYRNDLFDDLDGCFCMEVRFKHTNFTGFGSTISVNSATYEGETAHKYAEYGEYRLKGIEDVLSIHHVTGSKPTFEVRLIRNPATDRWQWLWHGGINDTELHTVQVQVLGDPKYGLRIRRAGGEWQQIAPVDPAETSSGLLPHSIYIGSHADQSKEMKDEQKQGRWTELWVDYIRISRGAWVSLESKDCAAAHATAPPQ